MPSVPSNATPLMLSWARKKEGLTIESVSALERIKPERLAGWEDGKGTPSLAMLERLAKRYHRPSHIFYLTEPPQGFSVVRDFRILPDTVPRSYSSPLRRAIRVAQERQAWAADYLETEGYTKSSLVNTYSPDDEAVPIGRDLREMLGAKIGGQSGCSGPPAAFVYWRRLVERAGVFVFQANRIEVEEMRGFSLPNVYAPAVVINARENFLPKVFTLIHELAHVLIGKTSLSGAGSRAFVPRPGSKIERFCNQVATEVLVPRTDFLARVPSDWANRDDEVLRELARFYWVSTSVIALRLTETGLADKSYAKQKLGRYKRKDEPTEPRRITQARQAIGRVGESFTRVVLGAYNEGSIHAGQLSALLNMKLRHLPQLEKMVLPGQAQPAP